MSRPTYVIHEDEVAEEEGHYPPPFDGEKLSLGRNLGRAAGSVAVGMWRERIPPGRRTSFTHAHSDEEELVYVLGGECTLRVVAPGEAASEHALRRGHTVSFPARTGIAHTFVNRSTEDCHLLCFGERKPGVDRAYYPEDAAYDAHRAKHEPHKSWKP